MYLSNLLLLFNLKYFIPRYELKLFHSVDCNCNLNSGTQPSVYLNEVVKLHITPCVCKHCTFGFALQGYKVLRAIIVADDM